MIVGQSHFIKTVEDLHEVLVGTSPHLRFGVAFCEASGKRLVRTSGNDDELVALATNGASAIGAGHCFVVFLRDGYPVNVLNQIKQVAEVCSVFSATANPVEVIVAKPPSDGESSAWWTGARRSGSRRRRTSRTGSVCCGRSATSWADPEQAARRGQPRVSRRRRIAAG